MEQKAAEPEAPRPDRRNLRAAVYTVLLAGACALGVWVWLRDAKPFSARHERETRHEDAEPPVPRAESQAHLRVVAQALAAYRDQFGGGVRWPGSLQELADMQLLPEGCELKGLISRRPLCYHADMPAGHDPGRWVLCADAEIGWRRVRGNPYPVRGVRTAVVILGDGTVATLGEEDIDRYGPSGFGLPDAR